MEPTVRIPPPPVEPSLAHQTVVPPSRLDFTIFQAGPSTLPYEPPPVIVQVTQLHKLLVFFCFFYDFRKLHPPTFLEVDSSPEPCRYIEVANHICIILRCS